MCDGPGASFSCMTEAIYLGPAELHHPGQPRARSRPRGRRGVRQRRDHHKRGRCAPNRRGTAARRRARPRSHTIRGDQSTTSPTDQRRHRSRPRSTVRRTDSRYGAESLLAPCHTGTNLKGCRSRVRSGWWRTWRLRHRFQRMNGEGRRDRVAETPGSVQERSARRREPGGRLHARTLPAVAVVLERSCKDLAGLLELWAFLELPNNLAGLPSLPVHYLLKFLKDPLLRHPLVPIAFAK